MKNLIIFFDNHVNPIVVKELRQGLQSWFIIVIVNLMLVALTLTCVLTVMTNPEITEEATGGRDMFIAIQVVLFSASIVCVPLYVLHRLQTEREGSNVDLFFTTTLKPQKIVRGKFIAGMSLITLLYSVCLPFILFTYFLQGYDIPTMLFTLLMGYLASIPILMAAIMTGSWTIPRVFALFSKGGAVWGLIIVVAGLNALSTHEILGKGIQTYLRDDRFLWTCGIIFMGGFLLTKLLEMMAIGLLAPPASNRTCRLRIWMSITIFSVAAVLIVLGIHIKHTMSYGATWSEVFLNLTFGWTIIALVLISIMLIIAICEPDKFSNRIMVQRPRFLALRVITFPFTHGASSGIFWCMVHAGIVFGTMYTVYSSAMDTSSARIYHELEKIDKIMPLILVFFLCVVAYALLAKLLMRTVFRRIPAKHSWATFLFTFMALVLFSIVVCFIIDMRHWDRLLFWKIFNPMSEFSYHVGNYSTQLKLRITIDVIWALAMLLLCTPKGILDAMRYLFDEPGVALDEVQDVTTQNRGVPLAAEGAEA